MSWWAWLALGAALGYLAAFVTLVCVAEYALGVDGARQRRR